MPDIVGRVTSDETRDGVPLTNLDQPLFDGADATKRDLVDYLDAVSDRILPVLRGPAAVGDPGAAAARRRSCRRTCPSTPRTGCRRSPIWAEASQRRGRLRAVQRPADAAVVRQPAGGRVPPDAGPGRPAGPPDPPGARPRPAGGRRRSRLVVRAAAAGPAGAGRRRAGRRGEDQRRQGRARVRAAGRRARRSRTWPRPPGRWRRGPSGSTRRSPPPRSSGRTAAGQGVPRLDPGRRRDRGRRLQPAGPARACRCRSRWPGTTSTGVDARATSPSAPRRRCSATATRGPSCMPAPQRAARRPGRGGPHDPDRPGAGDARGQAPRPRQARRLITAVLPGALRSSWSTPGRRRGRRARW